MLGSFREDKSPLEVPIWIDGARWKRWNGGRRHEKRVEEELASIEACRVDAALSVLEPRESCVVPGDAERLPLRLSDNTDRSAMPTATGSTWSQVSSRMLSVSVPLATAAAPSTCTVAHMHWRLELKRRYAR